MLKNTLLRLTGLILINCSYALASTSNLTNSSYQFLSKHPIYFEAQAGMANQDWTTSQTSLLNETTLPADAISVASLSWSNGDQRFVFGADLGFRLMPYLAIEGGFFNFANADFSGTSTTTDSGGVTTNYKFNGKIKSWMAYTAFKITLLHDEGDNMRFFGKVGIAYFHDSYSYNITAPSAHSASIDSNIWSPVLGYGGEIDFTSKLYVSAQYLYTMDTNSSSNGTFFEQPSGGMYVGAIGIHF